MCEGLRMLDALRAALCGLGAVYLAVRFIRFLDALRRVCSLSRIDDGKPVAAEATGKRRGRRARHIS